LTMKQRLERENQPAVLSAASRFLQQLTDGRYSRIWTPLERKAIRLDDESGRSWDLADLSGGTREQVFLSLRLALIEGYAKQGIEMPVVLDDVLVNFDHRRTEAAVAMLQKLAESGRQILMFTCHDHIAEMFRSHGATPQTLPGRGSTGTQRLAG